MLIPKVCKNLQCCGPTPGTYSCSPCPDVLLVLAPTCKIMLHHAPTPKFFQKCSGVLKNSDVFFSFISIPVDLAAMMQGKDM